MIPPPISTEARGEEGIIVYPIIGEGEEGAVHEILIYSTPFMLGLRRSCGTISVFTFVGTPGAVPAGAIGFASTSFIAAFALAILSAAALSAAALSAARLVASCSSLHLAALAAFAAISSL